MVINKSPVLLILNPRLHQTLILNPDPLSQIMAINESPVLLILNPRVDPLRKDLPVTLYETGALAVMTFAFCRQDAGAGAQVKGAKCFSARTSQSRCTREVRREVFEHFGWVSS